MHVAQIWQYPVKSLIGTAVEGATLDSTGIVGDRQWALRDVASGNLANCRQTPGIMRLAAAAAARLAPTIMTSTVRIRRESLISCRYIPIIRRGTPPVNHKPV